MKEIKLANNKGITFVDDEDYEWLNRFKWHINYGYATTNIVTDNKQKSKHIHQFIIDCPKNMEIDHVDNNGLNNQRSNLRIVTHHQNTMNRSKQNGTYTSQYKGVCWSKQCKKWRVNITLDNKTYFLGRFKDEKEAALTYNKKARELYGEYAYLNIIEE